MRRAGKNRTFFKRLDVLPRKLPLPLEQQWKLFTICDPPAALCVALRAGENRLP